MGPLRTKPRPTYFNRVTDWLEHQPTFAIVICGALVIVLVGAIDCTVPQILSFQVFYLLTAVACCWFSNGRVGIALSILSILIWGYADTNAISASPVPMFLWNAIVRLGSFGLAIYLTRSVRQSYDRERKYARTDPLTGLLNRRSFMQVLDCEISRARRYGLPLSLAYLDLDNFKSVNDRDGHEAGDRLLNAIARQLQKTLRGSDAAGRIGGDEFLVLFANTDGKSAHDACDRLRRALLDLGHGSTSFSIGLVTAQANSLPATGEALIVAADSLMYRVKQGAKNGISSEHYRFHDGGGSLKHRPEL